MEDDQDGGLGGGEWGLGGGEMMLEISLNQIELS